VPLRPDLKNGESLPEFFSLLPGWNRVYFVWQEHRKPITNEETLELIFPFGRPTLNPRGLLRRVTSDKGPLHSCGTQGPSAFMLQYSALPLAAEPRGFWKGALCEVSRCTRAAPVLYFAFCRLRTGRAGAAGFFRAFSSPVGRDIDDASRRVFSLRTRSYKVLPCNRPFGHFCPADSFSRPGPVAARPIFGQAACHQVLFFFFRRRFLSC